MQRTSATPTRSLLSMLTLALILGAGCKTNSEPAPGGDAGDEGATTASGGAQLTGEAPRGEAPTGGAPTRNTDPEEDPRADRVEIQRAATAASVGAKGAKNMGFSLDKISHLFALAATPKLPDWGAQGEGEAKLAHDDDLDTAWSCEFGQATPCVLGLALPESAKVEAIRLYTGAGPRFRDYTGHPRAAKVRVHTDAGYIEASLSDGANHTYVRFAEPVTTQSLAIEVLEVHPGKKNNQLGIAEVEVYGADGVPRAPIQLDPADAWVGWETTAWGGPELDHTIRQLFIYFRRPGVGDADDVGRRRFARATAVYGQAGDDYALFERLNGTDCEAAEGGYVLFDKRSRVYYPIGDLGGAGGQVYRHAEGHGFAVGWMDDDTAQFTIKGITEDKGKLVRLRPPKAGVSEGAAELRSWGFDPKPISRGEPLSGAVAGCHRAGTGELAALEDVVESGASMDPAQWMVCGVGSDTLYTNASCGELALAYQLDAQGKLVGKHEGKDPDARGSRLRRVGDDLYLELSSKQGDSASLYLARPGALTQLERNGGLAARPPSSCRPCVDTWPNPHATDTDAPETPEAPSEDSTAPSEDSVDAPEPATPQPVAPPAPTPPEPNE